MDASVTDIATEPKASTGKRVDHVALCRAGPARLRRRFAIIILPAYMTALGYDAVAVGIVATASLLGTALLTLITGWIAPRHDLRALLISGAGLMAATGLAFPGVEHFVLIVLVAFIGTINPSGGDLGVLVPLEHAVLAHSATDDRRTEVFARYSLIGALCTAAGSLAATLPDFLVSHGGTTLGAFRVMFYAYAALGILAPRSIVTSRIRAARRGRRRRRSGLRAAPSTNWRRCSASTPLPAVSSPSPCWCSGCSSALICHCPRPDCFSSGRAR